MRRFQLEPRKAGVGVIFQALNDVAEHDAAVLFAVSAIVMVLLVGWFRCGLRGTLTAAAAVTLACIWTLGAYAATGRSLNMVTMVLPSLVLVIGLSSSVHMLLHMRRSASRGESRGQGIGAIIRPCLLCAATTAAGFGSLAISRIPVIRDLGLFAALGVVCAALLAIVLCPLLATPRRAERCRCRRCDSPGSSRG